MKLEYYKGDVPNFGDDLNSWLWPRLLPNFFDENDQEWFLGIGSIIGSQYDTSSSRKIVFGSGYVSDYQDLPDLSKNWDVVCVRGPRTARKLNISDSLAICDSAILAQTIFPYEQTKIYDVSFVPHFQSIPRGNWTQVCSIAGINLIDPRLPVESVMKSIASSKVLIAEAMHSAIIADAFRVPWIPVLPLDARHREKWFDWAESLKVELTRSRLWPSTIVECRRAFERRPILSAALSALAKSSLSEDIDKGLTRLTAYHLAKIAKEEPLLSRDDELTRAVNRLLAKLEETRKKYYEPGAG